MHYVCLIFYISVVQNPSSICITGIVADHPDEIITFQITYSHHPLASSSFSSLLDDTNRSSFDIFDFSIYMDQVYLVYFQCHELT